MVKCVDMVTMFVTSAIATSDSEFSDFARVESEILVSFRVLECSLHLSTQGGADALFYNWTDERDNLGS